MAKRVVLVRQCKTPEGWRRYPVVIGRNGRVKANFVTVAGSQREYPIGHYELRTFVDGKPAYENVGSDPTEALARRDREIRNLKALESAIGSDVQVQLPAQRRTLLELKDDFLEKVQLSTKNSGLSAYRLTLDAFFPTLRKMYPEEIVTLDILRFSDALRRSGLSARTVWNRVHSLMSFLKFCGLPTAKLLDHNERPVKPENTPESYDLKDVKTLLDSCNPYNRIVFESFLKLGVREQELAFLEWPDVHWQDGVVTVRNKPQLGFSIKTYQGRSIPVEAGLLTRLRAWQLSRPGTRFVFGTANDRRNTKLLLALKGAVRRAGLNCRKCDTCKTRKECERWFLHRFRATFATTALQKGLDIHSLMKLMGHKDLASTMRYLSRNDEVTAKINNIFGSI